MTDLYDFETLKRFINDALHGDNPDNKAAAEALLHVIEGKDIQKEMGLKKKIGGRGKKIDVDNLGFNDEAFWVAMGYIASKEDGSPLEYIKPIKYGKAVERLMDITGKEIDTCKKYLTAMKPHAQQQYDQLKLLHNLSNN